MFFLIDLIFVVTADYLGELSGQQRMENYVKPRTIKYLGKRGADKTGRGPLVHTRVLSLFFVFQTAA